MATYTKTCSNNGSYTLRLELSESNVSIANNTSVLNYALYLDSTYPRFEDWDVTYTLYIGSEVSVKVTKSMSMPATRKQPLLLTSGSKTVTHDNNGQKSLSVSCSISTATSQSYLPGSASISGKTFSLTTIARKSTLTTVGGKISVTLRSVATLQVNRQNSSFTHTISYSLGDSSAVIVSKSGTTSISWTPPVSLYLKMVGQTVGYGTITIETFNGSSSLGKNSYPATFNAYQVDGTSIVYNTPGVLDFSYERGSGNSDSNWVSNQNGSDVKIKYSLRTTSGIPGNSTQGAVRLGNAVIGSFSDISSGTYSLYKTGVGTDTTHTVSILLSDSLGYSNSWNLTISTVLVPFNINVKLPGIACGKVAESVNTLELADDWDLKLKGNTLSDFVVDQGTSDLWTYRKWNSGIAECWGLYVDSGVSITKAWGVLYESSRSGGISFPGGLFNSTPVSNLQVLASPQGAILSLEITGSDEGSKRTPYWAYTRPNNTITSATVTIGMYAIGTWK